MAKLPRFERTVAVLIIGLSGCGSDDNGAAQPNPVMAGGSAGLTSGSGGAAAGVGTAGAAAGTRAGTGGSGTAGAASGASGMAALAGSGGSAGSAEDDADAGVAEPGTFSHLYSQTFKVCSIDICHGGDGLAGLDMSSRANAYRTLINVPASTSYPCANFGKDRVEPGKPEDSLLYLKLNPNAPCGQQMPAGGKLTDPQIAEVEMWIKNGAKDD